jgi:NADH-quinone oxidoreductase subunit K
LPELVHYLAVSAILFCIGLYGIITRKNAVVILMSIEFMLNAANLNFVAFSRYSEPYDPGGYVFAMLSIALAAAEVAVGIAILLVIYRRHKSIDVTNLDVLRG